MQPPSLRALTPADFPAARRLSDEAGWNQLEADWRLFLDLNPDGARVAEADAGRVAATVTTLDFGLYSWIAMLLVDPEFRRRGFGTAMLLGAIEMLEGSAAIGLDATPEGRAVYRKHGFEDSFELARFVRDGGDPSRELGAADSQGLPEQAAQMDREAAGADRAAILQSLLSRAPQVARFTGDGFVLGRPGRLALHLGPIIAHDRNSARELLQQALAKAAGSRVFVDAPLSDPAWVADLGGLGFRPVRQFTRMFRGHQPVAKPAHVFATIGPEFS